MKLYHVSPLVYLERIKEEGLLPRWQWVNPPGRPREWQQEPVHLAEEPEAGFIADLHGSPEVVLFEVNPYELTLKPGYDGEGHWMVYEWVRPQLVTYLHDIYTNERRPA